MMTIGLAVVVLVLAAIPALLFRANLRAYRPPPAASRPGDTGVSPGAFGADTSAQRGARNRRCCASGPRQPGRRA